MLSSYGGDMFVLPNSEKMKASIIMILVLLSTGLNLPARGQVLKIFLDCLTCDMEYFRTNFTDVNYVHERQDADVHVLVSALPTGIGGSFSASKVTEAIKFESGNGFGYSQARIKYYDSDTLASYTIKQQRIYSQNLLVKSFGNHWGIGGFASLYRNIQENYDFQAQIGPAVEYNLFSYKEAADRQCRFLYSMTYEYADYHDLTLYNSMQESLFSHNLGVSFTYLEPWGTLSASAGGTAYLDDMTQYSVGVAASADVNIHGGLSVILSGNAGYSQNERYLRGGEGKLTDILTSQWQQETGLYYGFNIGIAYSFGSKYNNAVNPRFGF